MIALTKKPNFRDQKCSNIAVHEDELIENVITKVALFLVCGDLICAGQTVC